MNDDIAKMEREIRESRLYVLRRVSMITHWVALVLLVIGATLAVASFFPGHTPGIEWWALGFAIAGAVSQGVSFYCWRIA